MRFAFVILLALVMGCQASSKVAVKTTPTPRASDTPRPPTPTPGPSELAVDNAVVHIKNHAFVPASIAVRQGGTVTWLNDDKDPHTVTPTLGAAFSGTDRINAGESSGKVTFGTVGDQTYACDFHSDMKGTIIVVAK